MPAVVVLLFAQLIYSVKDLLARSLVKGGNFGAEVFQKPLFYLILVMHFTALMLQLYVLSEYQLSRAMTGFAVISIIFASVLGFIFLGEKITLPMYIAISLAFASLLVIAFVVK